MRQIRIVDASGEEHFFPVEEPVTNITIGRSQNNDIILNSQRVSRRHAVLKLLEDRFLLINQSANGVMVNGERVSRVKELDPGEFAQIDQYKFCVEASDEEGFDTEKELADEGLDYDEDPLSKETITDSDVEEATEKQASDDSDTDGRFDVDDMEEYLGEVAVDPNYQEPRISLTGEEVETREKEAREELIEFKAQMHDELKGRLDLHSFDIEDYRDPSTVRRVTKALKTLLEKHAHEIPEPFTRDEVFKEMMDQVCGLGPIEDLIKYRGVTEIMVVDREHVYAELDGEIVLTDRFFNDEKAMMTVIERIVIPQGRRVDETNPMVDTRLDDGSRVNAVIPPLALKDPCLTIRKFPEDRLEVDDLVEFESFTPEMAKFLGRAVRARKNIIISGGTGSGKTTLLNVMSGFIGPTERVVTIEDAAELQLQQDHVVSLETKPPNLEGEGEVTIRDLVKNSLRMRPDRIVVGECRGGEALDMLQAMNTGHEGSMTTVHSNNPTEAIARLETLVMMSGMELPPIAIRRQIANSVDLIVQQTRYSDGSRRVSQVTEVVELTDEGDVRLEDIYKFKQTGLDEDQVVQGYFLATGYLPSFLNDFIVQGLATEEDFF